jgi:A/G-specific adenine glycosylase
MPRREHVGAADRDLEFVRTLVRWFRANARDLPWRQTGPQGLRDPYAALVSELMLQQTQVSRVLEKFAEFMRRFPTAAALAAAPERDVLAAWSGLGYYRRAKLLHCAAKTIVTDHGGVMPRDIETLRSLPGVGRYTAGAIASMVFGGQTPLVDGNVVRVLLRFDARRGRAGDGESDEWTWRRAESLVSLTVRGVAAHGARSSARHAPRAGEFNEALMEFGALVCVPRSPKCDVCPVRSLCAAHIAGVQEDIPTPKPEGKRKTIRCAAVVLRDTRGRVLVEERPHDSMFAGMHQPPTIECETGSITKAQVERALSVHGLRVRERFIHKTTHRDLEFTVYESAEPILVEDAEHISRGRRWVTNAEMADLALGTPQRRMLMGA